MPCASLPRSCCVSCAIAIAAAIVLSPAVSVSGDDSVCAERSSSTTELDPAWLLSQGAGTNRKLIVPDDTSGGGGEGRTLEVERLSVHPPIFRVQNFLTAKECESLRRLAVEEGLTDGFVDSNEGLVSSGGGKKKKKMRLFDANNDGRLSVNELIRMFDDFFESHLQEDDIHSVLSFVNLPLDDAGMISIQDFVRADTASIRRFLLQLLRDNPSKLSRHSRMAWINIQTQQSKDDVHLLESIERRVAQLTQLPKSVVSGDMEMQIVHYSPNFTNKDGTRGGGGGGHYTAHLDSLSPTIDAPCCHTTKGRPPCRPCRLATILYNLSDGDGDGAGGHTAFPLSGKTQEECSVEAVEAWKISAASRESSYCASTGPGLRVEPQLGQAVLWYNHNLITADDLGKGVLGELDRSTLHAGCPSWVARDALTDGSSSLWNGIPGKWIANHWISDVDQGQQRGSGFP